MVARIAYEHRAYRSADDCVEGIREHVERGWTVALMRGGRRGPFTVVYRKEERGGRFHPAG